MPNSGTLVKERLRWVQDLKAGLLLILGDAISPVFKATTTTDPLKVILTIGLNHPLPKASRQPMRNYIRAWAKTGDCEIPRIQIDKHGVYAEVLVKRRLEPGKARDEETDSGTG